MSWKSASIEACTDFPQFDSFISGTGYKIITIHNKINKANIMIMAMKGLTTGIVIIQIPEFDAEITGWWN